MNMFIMQSCLPLPVFVSVSVNDINIIVNRRLASTMGEGAASILYYSNKLNTMIIGIFITAITAIVFPILTRTLGSGDMKLGKKVMNASVKTVLFITVPATVGLIILARPIIEIAFVRGSFTAADGVAATSTLRCYSLSLISISVINVLNRIYYSIGDTKTPFYVGVTNVIINVGLNLLVARHFGTNGLAASVSIATTIAVFISFILLKKNWKSWNKILHQGPYKNCNGITCHGSNNFGILPLRKTNHGINIWRSPNSFKIGLLNASSLYCRFSLCILPIQVGSS